MDNQQKCRIRIVSKMRGPEIGQDEIKHARSGFVQRTAEGIVLDYDDEQHGENGERAHITLTMQGKKAQMKRQGMTSAVLSFVPGTKIASAYVTIYGEIPVAIDTRRLLLTEQEKGGELVVDYDVYMGGEKTSSTLLTVTWRI